jgi:hypothetical protein
MDGLSAFLKQLDLKTQNQEEVSPPTIREVIEDLADDELAQLILAAADQLDYIVRQAKTQDDRSPETMANIAGLSRIIDQFSTCIE